MRLVEVGLSKLLERIEQVDIVAADGALIGELAQGHDRVEAKLVEALAEFVRAGRHDVEGWPSPVSWVKAHLAVTDAQAVNLVMRTRRMNDWPTLAGLWLAGELSAAQVDTVVRPVGRDHVELLGLLQGWLTFHVWGCPTGEDGCHAQEVPTGVQG